MPKKAKRKTATSKKSTKKTPATPKAAKSKGRGKRYTPAQKAKVLNYVNEVNAKKGRGGAAAASRKFGISQITIGQWVKKSGGAAPSGKKAAAKRGPKPGAKRGRKPGVKVVSSFAAQLRRLADVHESIAMKKAEIASLEKEYAKLKKSL